MSAFFFCSSCGHNLTFYANRRLKCYGCGKLYADRPFICNCRKDDAFTFSIEIVDANKGRCVLCGEESTVPGNLEPSYTDQKKGAPKPIMPFRAVPPKTRKTSLREEKIPIPFEPECDIIENGLYEIILTLPSSCTLQDLHWEVRENLVTIESAHPVFSFRKEFRLSQNMIPDSLETKLQNGVFILTCSKSPLT